MRNRKRQIYNLTSNLPTKRTIRKHFRIFLVMTYLFVNYLAYTKLLDCDINGPVFGPIFGFLTSVNFIIILLIIIFNADWINRNIIDPIGNFFKRMWNVFPD